MSYFRYKIKKNKKIISSGMRIFERNLIISLNHSVFGFFVFFISFFPNKTYKIPVDVFWFLLVVVIDLNPTVHFIQLI